MPGQSLLLERQLDRLSPFLRETFQLTQAWNDLASLMGKRKVRYLLKNMIKLPLLSSLRSYPSNNRSRIIEAQA